MWNKWIQMYLASESSQPSVGCHGYSESLTLCGFRHTI
ncbi:hypothetical protein CBM2633_B40100 [Cupriavidus taiwanensis]|nr:hypothetical protein CBM2633_B40100 [Cupriavidus taiwanensis]